MRNLPIPGFRFYPTEEELVSFYLRNKLRGTGPHELDRLIPVLDIYDYNPFDLPHLAGERCPAEGDEWFFFIPRPEREARGGRPNRLTSHGYWKATGSPGDVYSSQNRVIGRKRTMVFYVGRAPNGVKTEWKMNEYKAISDTHELLDQPSSSSSTVVVANPLPELREEFSLCRIYRKSKYVRAFDRRPAADPAVRADNQSAINQLPSTQRNNEATTTFNSPEISSPIITSPHEITQIHTTLGECSFSGDHQTASTNPYSRSENSNTDVEMDSESFWDSEDFSWFDI